MYWLKQNDIRIQSSTFYFGNYSEALLESFNVNNLVLSDNYIAANVTTPIISFRNSPLIITPLWMIKEKFNNIVDLNQSMDVKWI